MLYLILGAAGAALLIWAVSVRRKLAVMEENVRNAMGQIGVQLSSRFDALTGLLELTREYDPRMGQVLLETVRTSRGIITAESTAEDVRGQEQVISRVLEQVSSVAELEPRLRADANFAKYMNAVDSYGKMVCTSGLIYNDGVARLNRELRRMPVSAVGGILGFRPRACLEMPDFLL